ncbi:MAG: hypothetical protein ACOYM8_17080 [Caulobacterales bacterium]
MGFLEEIQAALVSDGDLSAALLKLRLLAAKLGNHPLEAWVKHESEGYPADAEVPAYRRASVTYTGDFEDFTQRRTGVPIPSFLIAKFADEKCNTHEFREGIAEIALLEEGAKTGKLSLQAANLIFALQGKVYPGMNCQAVSGAISPSSLSGIRSAVKNRVLELTIELEKAVPEAKSIGFGQSATVNEARVTQVINQVFHGDATSILNTGSGANLNVNVTRGDGAALAKALTDAGIAKSDAEAFAAIVATEKPESKAEPFGAKAKAWIAANIKKSVDGTWAVGIGVATTVLSRAALKYYGFEP